MIDSPLVLVRHFFTRIHLEACPVACEGHWHLASQVSAAHHKEDRRKWMVTLRVQQQAQEAQRPPYEFEIEAVGLFRVADECPADKVQQLVEVNGPALLYGAIRELVLNLTSRGPHPAVQLPAATFIDSLKRSPEGAQKKPLD